MEREISFNYRKSFFFLISGIASVLLAGFLIAPFLICRSCWNQVLFSHWWYLYVFPNLIGLALLAVGFSNLSFWFGHIRKKPYLVITDDMIKIDAETDIKIGDIVSTVRKNFLGCEMLCLEIKNPQDYKFSWRFRADRIFHKKYHAFVCPDLVAKEQKADFLNWFGNVFPNKGK